MGLRIKSRALYFCCILLSHYVYLLQKVRIYMQYKICSGCKINKPFSDYFKDNLRKIGIRCKCKECCAKDTVNWRNKNRSGYNNYVAMWRAKNPERQHKTEIKRRYALSIEKYNEMLIAQNCQCKICKKQHDPSEKRGRLYVDHCHESGEIRGLLCGACNKGLGCFGDDIDRLYSAISYLAKT